MRKVLTYTNPEKCRELWKSLIPDELISDLWEVRECFHENYSHELRFIVVEENGQITGFLPLSWNEETKQYNYFPGETWEGKTWLEQNRIICKDRETLNLLLGNLDNAYYLRYLRTEKSWSRTDEHVDEIGYLFFPENYKYSMDKYFESFSHKTAKKLKKELAAWDEHKIDWRFNNLDDFDVLSEMNQSRYGRLSYFYDKRFLNSFHKLKEFLHDRNWLRIVSVSIDDEPAAIDMGSLYNGMLTMLAGGTNEKFRGIAKLINMHHLNFACEQKLDSVDFLCGDFNWKTLFHLAPSPLYLLDGTGVADNRNLIRHYDLPSRDLNESSLGETPYV